MKSLLTLVLGFIMLSSISAQQFVESFGRFSNKKLAYITLENGEEIQGFIKDVDRKKGLIKSIKIKDESGKKHKFKPDAIKEMYLPATELSKLVNVHEKMHDATKWNEKKIMSDKIKDGYAYYIKTDVKIKSKTKTLLLQLLNPTFSDKIMVFDDPYAGEKMSLGVGNIKVAGGGKKSFYVKKGDDVAYKMKSKKYKKAFKSFYGCKSMSKEFKKVKWSELGDHILYYTNECK